MTPLNDPLTIDWLIELWFYDTKYFISETFPQANILAWYGKTKPNTTKARIHQSKEVGVPGAVWASWPWTKHVSDRLAIFTPPPIGEWSIVMSVSVCLSVCLCVCLSAIISLELDVRSSPNVLCILPMVVARSSSGAVVIRYVYCRFYG